MISTTIKKEYFKKIEAGTKRHEYKPDSEFWRTRILGKEHHEIGFLCGRVYRVYRIENISKIPCPSGLEWLGTENVFDIALGQQIPELGN